MDTTFFRGDYHRTVEELQVDLDVWLHKYNELRPHSGRYCYGKTPMQTFMDAKSIVKEKMFGNIEAQSDSLTYLTESA